ncbi:MAG: alpha/beta fold hydrolase [Chrysiogenetes bacterium]|nr:alpha/beta fold hydrolase [Chrysiogenetes bacterium]
MPVSHRPHYDAVHRVATSDGWPIALYEYKPKGAPQPGAAPKAPLLAVHGAFSRFNIYDMTPGVGLAPWLAERGWHVFALDLRGRGESLPRRALRRSRALLQQGWTYHDFVRHDIPAAIGAVLEKSGANQTDYIGHSMGGLLAYTYLGETEDQRVRRVVTVGSPGMFSRPNQQALPKDEKRVDLLQLVAPFMETMPIIPVHLATRALSLLGERAPKQAIGIALNPDNTDPEVLRTMLWHGLTPVSSKKFKSFLHFTNIGSPEAAKNVMERFSHPVMLISGQKDLLVPPTLVRDTFEALGSTEKSQINCAKAEGFSADYGHGDLLVGRNVAKEVFPRIQDWLTRG